MIVVRSIPQVWDDAMACMCQRRASRSSKLAGHGNPTAGGFKAAAIGCRRSSEGSVMFWLTLRSLFHGAMVKSTGE